MNSKRKNQLGEAEQVLINHGIDKNEAPQILREIGFALLDRDIYSKELEDRQAICNAVRDALLLTHNAGSPNCNSLVELKYLPDREVVRPIFENGAGADGYYDVDVCADSGTAVIFDIAKQFIRKMW